MMSSLFEKKPILSASLVALFFIALALAGSIDFSRGEKSLNPTLSWSFPAGEGVSVPACASGSAEATCVNGRGSITISWSGFHGDPNPDFGFRQDDCTYLGTWVFWGSVPPTGSQTFTDLPSNTSYCYGLGDGRGQVGYTTISTPNCEASGASAPVAEAGISLDNVSFGTSVSVLRGIPAQIWFSADRDVTGDGLSSRDPDGWTNPTDGVSRGGKCEWNIDLQKPGFFVQRTVSDPASPAACNLGPLAKTFNDAPGTYLYEVLRVTDAAGLESNISTVFVTITSPVSVSLVANPPIINPGGSSLLTWDTEGFGPGDCSIDQGIGAVSPDGTKLVSPTVTTVYTLSCLNAFNSASTQATVYVLTIPTIKEIPPG